MAITRRRSKPTKALSPAFTAKTRCCFRDLRAPSSQRVTGAGAQAALDTLRETNPDFNSPDAHLTYAQALEAQGKDAEAAEEYEELVKYYPGEEARFRYAMLLIARDRRRGRKRSSRRSKSARRSGRAIIAHATRVDFRRAPGVEGARLREDLELKCPKISSAAPDILREM